MRRAITAATLTLVTLAALCTAQVLRGPRTSAKAKAGATSQKHSKQSGTASNQAGQRKIPCRTPENASLCYWTHGRLSVYNGDPTYRIWKIGTRRILGVFNGPSRFPPRTDADFEDPEFPAKLESAYEANGRRWKWTLPPPVFADFQVCPLEPQERGEMQAVCIESAKNIFFENVR